MDLRSFVAETLTQIVGGVEDARSGIKAINPAARVNPSFVSSGRPENQHAIASPVEFDVAIVVSEESSQANSDKVGGSAGFLSVVTARLSTEMQNGSQGAQRNETASRVKFTVQLAQPGDLKVINS